MPKQRQVFRNAFYLGMASVWPLHHKGLSFWMVLPSPKKNSGALSVWPSGSWSPSWLRTSLSLAGRPALGSVLVVPNSLHLRMMVKSSSGPSMLQFFFYPSPDLCLDTILSQRCTDNSFNLMVWFLLWHALSTVGPYINRCVRFQIMSNQLTTGGLHSSCRNMSKMINGNRMKLSSIIHMEIFQYFISVIYQLLIFLSLLYFITVFGTPTAPRAFELLTRFTRSQFGTNLRQCACISDSAAPSLSFSITPFLQSIFQLSWMGRCWLAKTNHMTIQPPCSRKCTSLVAWTLMLAIRLRHITNIQTYNKTYLVL